MSLSRLFLEQLYNDDLMAGRKPTKEAPSFGKRLAAIRKAQGLSQERFAQLIGSTRSNIDYYERRATNPTLEFIQKCAETLNVDVVDLIGDSSDSESTRKKGPKSKLETRFEKIRSLSKKDQSLAIDMLDRIINSSGHPS